ncbi:g1790 [Coccomyxa viridis]|uniref:G1790 protein n=1 Tax=Coccomyxa viridis TaxID=1274662 RepID=A0ABP1FIV5_9CHLO
MLCSAWMMFDSIIASITGLDQSKYAEYEPNPEECGQSDLKERVPNSLGMSNLAPSWIAAPHSHAISANAPHRQQEV